MGRKWQIQEAKNKLSEVVEQAVNDGPQVITRRGVDTAIILSFADYRKLVLQQRSLSEFFRDSPLVDANLDLARDTSMSREDLSL